MHTFASAFWGDGVSLDEMDSDHYLYNIGQGGLGLSRDYYFDTDAKSVKTRTEYKKFIAKQMKNFGIAVDADKLYKLEERMAKSFYPKEKTSKKQMNFFFILILIFTQIKFCYLSSCIVHDNFNTESCFNDIIIINNKDYRAGQIQVNNNNDLIIEFSDNKSPYDSRLFFP